MENEGKIVLLLVFAAVVCAADKTPVLIWSSDRPMSDLPQSYTGQTVDTQAFQKNYLTPLSKPGQHLIVFLQDQLSAEDFTKYADVYNPDSEGGSFKNVKSAMDDQFSVHLPSVESPKSAIETLTSSFPGEVVKVDRPEDVSSLPLSDKNYVIIVSLNAKHADMAKKFEEDDAAIGSCVRHLQKRGVKFTALYTAKASSKAAVDSEFAGRHLLAADDDDNNGTGVFRSTDDVLMYMKSVNISVTVGKDKPPMSILFTNFTLNSEAVIPVNSTNNRTVVMVSVDLTADNGTAQINMTLNTTYAQEWKSVDETVTFKMLHDPSHNHSFEDVRMDFDITAPEKFSYHCTKLSPKLGRNTTIGQGTMVSIVLDGFQIEAFSNFSTDANNGTLRFTDNVWDCVVFFTPPIWMGIVTTIVLVLILFYAITMIANITTMDRFDDPKGKGITITVNE